MTSPHPTYLTAEQIGITPLEHSALRAVKTFIASLKPVQDPSSQYRHPMLREVHSPAQARFSMTHSVKRYDCGTACCIGGWMMMYMCNVPLNVQELAVPADAVQAIREYVNDCNPMSSLRQLFYPKHVVDYDAITPEDAVQEIERFLTTGNATW